MNAVYQLGLLSVLQGGLHAADRLLLVGHPHVL